MSSALFRSFGAFGAKGKVVLISVVTLLFSFFLIIPSTPTHLYMPPLSLPLLSVYTCLL